MEHAGRHAYILPDPLLTHGPEQLELRPTPAIVQPQDLSRDGRESAEVDKVVEPQALPEGVGSDQDLQAAQLAAAPFAAPGLDVLHQESQEQPRSLALEAAGKRLGQKMDGILAST